MSDDIETRLRTFFASAQQRPYLVDVLEISHPAMSTVFRLWRENLPGTITTEAGAGQAVTPMNFELKRAGAGAHLDQIYEIALDTVQPGVEQAFRREMGLVPVGTATPVQIILREYLSDDLTDMLTRAVLQLEAVSYKLGVALLTAVSPRFNVTRTGELYAPRDIPMLRRFH